MQESLGITSTTGIDLKLQVAGPGARSYAFVIDWHIRLLMALAWFLAASFIVNGGLALVGNEDANFSVYIFGAVLPTAAIYFLYHPILELVMRGRTPGKRMAGIRIVTMQGEEPSVMAVLIRNTLRLLDSLPVGYMLGLVMTLFTARAVRVGDLAAGTLLVYSTEQNPDAIQFTPQAVAKHGLERVELATDLLDRWESLDSDRRIELGRKMLANFGVGETEFAASADGEELFERLLALVTAEQ